MHISEDTQKTIRDAVDHLHKLDQDKATEQNGVGFSKADVQLGHISAHLWEDEWTEQLYIEVAGMLCKYCDTQLEGLFDTRMIKMWGRYACGRAHVRDAVEMIQDRIERTAHYDARIFGWDNDSSKKLTDFYFAWNREDPEFDEILQVVRGAGAIYDPRTYRWYVRHHYFHKKRAIFEGIIKDHQFNTTRYADISMEAFHRYVTQKSSDSGVFRVYFEYDCFELRDLIKKQPYRRWDSKERCWITDAFGAKAVLSNNLGVRIDADEGVWDAIKEQTAQQPDPTFVNPPLPLYPHQVEAIEYLKNNDRALLTDEMGLGKTISALMALRANTSALVICPAALKGNWAEECNVWRQDLKPVIIKGKANFRLPEQGELVIVNYELLPTAEDGTTGRLFELSGTHKPIVQCIVDEAHYLKKAKAQRTKNFRELQYQITRARGTVWLMTGTPLVTSPHDLWGVLASAGLHKKAYQSWTGFCDAWGGYKGRFGWEWAHGRIDRQAAEQGLKKVSLGRKREDVLPDLPSKRFSQFSIQVPRKMGEVSSELRDAMDECTSDQEFLKLKNKFAGELARHRKLIAIEKARQCHPLIKEILEGGGGPLVVFTAHSSAADKLHRQVNSEVYSGQTTGASEFGYWGKITGDTPMEDRQRIVEDFQAGKLAGVIGTIGAMGTGHTLTRSHRMIFIDLDWSPAINAQAEDRINRIGQKNACEYIHLVASCEVYQIMHSAITRKALMITSVDAARKLED